MSLMKDFKSFLTSFKRNSIKLGSMKLEDGRTIEFLGDLITLGSPVDLVNEDGSTTALPDGEYTLETGVRIVITAGEVSEIIDDSYNVEAEEQTQEEVVEEVAETVEEVIEEVTKEEGTEITESLKEAIAEAVAEAVAPLEAELKKLRASTGAGLSKLSKVVDDIAEFAGGVPAGEAVGLSRKPKKAVTSTPTSFASAFSQEVAKK